MNDGIASELGPGKRRRDDDGGAGERTKRVDLQRAARGDGGVQGTLIVNESGILSVTAQPYEDQAESSRRTSVNGDEADVGSTKGDKRITERESQVKRIAGDIHRRFEDTTGYYLSDVIPIEDDGIRKKFYEELIRRCRGINGRNVQLICNEVGHIHVVHDCSYSNKTCRCQWITQTENMYGFGRRRRSIRGRPICNQLGVSDWENILKYFYKKEGRTNYLQVGGQVQDVQFSAEDMEKQGPEGRDGLEGEAEQDIQVDDYELRWGLCAGDEVTHRVWRSRKGSEAVHDGKRSGPGKAVRGMAKVMELLKTYPMSPVHGIFSHTVWLTDPQLQYRNESDKHVMAVIDNWNKQLYQWSIEDFNVLFSDEACTPTFSAGCGNINEYYFDVKTSLKVLVELLNHQFLDPDEVRAFLKTLYCVLEKLVPKLNTILVHSPPSSGKNYFFDCIKDYFLNTGKLCRANKHNGFPFQDVANRRVVMWNEPNYSAEFEEQLKELLGGDTTNVSAKYKAEVQVWRTPVIILTNRNINLMNNPAFNDRMRIYRWKQAPFLRKLEKKPHPLATYKLFAYYNIDASNAKDE